MQDFKGFGKIVMDKDINKIYSTTKRAWNDNWKPHEIERVMEIFTYPRVKKQVEFFEKYLPKKERILEGGCGLGPYLLYFHKKGYKITGIDYNQDPLDKIKKYDSTVNVQTMDVKDLKFDDASFGGYLSLGVIEHFSEGPEKSIEEANRVLKNGGVFIVQVPIMNLFLMLKYPWELLKRNKFTRRILKKPQKHYYWQQYFKAGRLKYILEKRGFKVLEIRPMDHEHNIISTFGFLRDKSSYDGASNAGIKMSEFCEKYLCWPTAANMVLICRKES